MEEVIIKKKSVRKVWLRSFQALVVIPAVSLWVIGLFFTGQPFSANIIENAPMLMLSTVVLGAVAFVMKHFIWDKRGTKLLTTVIAICIFLLVYELGCIHMFYTLGMSIFAILVFIVPILLLIPFIWYSLKLRREYIGIKVQAPSLMSAAVKRARRDWKYAYIFQYISSFCIVLFSIISELKIESFLLMMVAILSGMFLFISFSSIGLLITWYCVWKKRGTKLLLFTIVGSLLYSILIIGVHCAGVPLKYGPSLKEFIPHFCIYVIVAWYSYKLRKAYLKERRDAAAELNANI